MQQRWRVVWLAAALAWAMLAWAAVLVVAGFDLSFGFAFRKGEGHLHFARMVRMIRIHGNGLTDELFDVFHIGFFFVVAKRNGLATRSSTSRTTNAMNIVI